MNKNNLPTIKDLEFGEIAGRIYSEHRGEIMRGQFTKTFSEKIAIALKQFRAENKRKARAARFANWPDNMVSFENYTKK